MNEDGIFRRRNLPHIDVEGKPFFITACLAGSISAAGLGKIRSYRDQLQRRPTPKELTPSQWKNKRQKLVFKLVDSLLDHQPHVTYLKDVRLAEVVQDAFLHFADERYRLLAFVVMPSHHHWLFMPDEQWAGELLASQTGKKKRTPREVISHSVQSYTGTICNRLRSASGAFWQTETFDHYARDEAEMLRIIEYIENNPVNAGLVDCPDQYRWSSAYLRKQFGVAKGDGIPKVG